MTYFVPEFAFNFTHTQIFSCQEVIVFFSSSNAALCLSSILLTVGRSLTMCSWGTLICSIIKIRYLMGEKREWVGENERKRGGDIGRGGREGEREFKTISFST